MTKWLSVRLPTKWFWVRVQLQSLNLMLVKFREAVNLKYLNRNELDKACFAHDVANSNITDLAERTISDEILKDRAYEIARSGNYDEY